MKKISLLALVLIASMAVFAQETQPKLRTPMAVTTRFGLRAGINMADLTAKNQTNTSGSVATEAESKTAFNGGVFVNVPI